VLSENSLRAVWDNEEEDVYRELLVTAGFMP
jgi:hypothetical protein